MIVYVALGIYGPILIIIMAWMYAIIDGGGF